MVLYSVRELANIFDKFAKKIMILKIAKPGPLQLVHWQSDAVPTKLDLIQNTWSGDFYYILYVFLSTTLNSTLLILPPFRFNCAGGCGV